MKRKKMKLKAQPQPRAKPAARKDESPRRVFMKQCLREWGVWRRSWHSGPGRLQSWWGKLWLDRFLPMNKPLPDREVNDERAHGTHSTIDGLDPLLRLVLLMQYVLGVHCTKEEKARACGLSVPSFYRAHQRALDSFEIRVTLLAEDSSLWITRPAPTCAVIPDCENIDIVV